MTNLIISDAITNISTEYIEKAVDYSVTKKKLRWKWKAIAACIAVIALMFGTVPFLNNSPAVSPFGLTAYALGNDNSLSTVTMREGENIPVGLFEADNGLWGFVFSHDVADPEQPVSISILNADQQSEATDSIEAIIGLEMEQGKNYVFFIPPQNEASPYSLPLSITDESTNTVGQLDIVIEQNEDGYTARLDKLTSFELKTAP